MSKRSIRDKKRRDNRDPAYLRVIFGHMKQRCYNPKDEAYPNYGGRGITICPEWLDNPEAFIGWALANGFKRELWIDRVDNEESYSPDNCQWSTPKEQARNRRDNVTDFEKGTRICNKCKTEKQFEEFHRGKSMPAGRQYICKQCLKK